MYTFRLHYCDSVHTFWTITLCIRYIPVVFTEQVPPAVYPLHRTPHESHSFTHATNSCTTVHNSFCQASLFRGIVNTDGGVYKHILWLVTSFFGGVDFLSCVFFTFSLFSCGCCEGRDGLALLEEEDGDVPLLR